MNNDGRNIETGAPPPGFGAKEVPRPTIAKWEKVGDSWTGQFLGLEKSRRYAGSAIMLGMCEGTLCRVPAPTMLADMLQGIAIGTEVHIRMDGKEKTPAGELKVFRVWTK